MGGNAALDKTFETSKLYHFLFRKISESKVILKRIKSSSLSEK